MALQRFRDGRHYLWCWNPLVLRCVSSIPCSFTAPCCVSRSLSFVLRDCLEFDDHHPLQKINWFLGQWPQMEQTWGQASQIRQYQPLREVICLGKTQAKQRLIKNMFMCFQFIARCWWLYILYLNDTLYKLNFTNHNISWAILHGTIKIFHSYICNYVIFPLRGRLDKFVL